MDLCLHGRDEVVCHFGEKPELDRDIGPIAGAPGLGARPEKIEKNERLVPDKDKPLPSALAGLFLIEELFADVSKMSFEASQALPADAPDGEHLPPATPGEVVEGVDAMSLKFRQDIAPHGRLPPDL